MEAAVLATAAWSKKNPPPTPVKIVIAGGFGVGKTTMVASLSEIAPVTTEVASRALDHITAAPATAASTAMMDYGRISLRDTVVLHLFGVPGQPRYRFMWDMVCHGACGAVVLVDVRRLADSFGPIDYVERAALPFVVVVNLFDAALSQPAHVLRDALALAPSVPLLACDARHRHSTRQVLDTLLEHLPAQRHRPSDPIRPPPVPQHIPHILRR